MEITAKLDGQLTPAVSVCSAEMGLTNDEFVSACVVTGIRAMAEYDPVIAMAVARYGLGPVAEASQPEHDRGNQDVSEPQY